MKKLSICIPTYNRAQFLDELLEKIITQINVEDIFDAVEILVSDNNSIDETYLIAEKYKHNIRYFKNLENIGPDANFLKLFEKAQGDYIWLPGDDDLIRSDTIRFLLKSIEKHDFDYLYLKTKGPSKKEWTERGCFSLDKIEFIKRINIYTTFMTSQVIRASLIKPKISKAKDYLGGFMAYYWLFLEALFSSKKCMISEEKEVFPGAASNTGGYKFYNVWSVSVFDVFLASSFSKERGIFSKMKFRMFFSLLLPITFRLKIAAGKSNFKDENPLESLNKYFGSFFYSRLINFYIKNPPFVLYPVHAVFKLVNFILSFIKKDIA